MMVRHIIRLRETGQAFFPLWPEASYFPRLPPSGYINGYFSGHRPSLLLSHNDQPPWRENLLEGPTVPPASVPLASGHLITGAASLPSHYYPSCPLSCKAANTAAPNAVDGGKRASRCPQLKSPCRAPGVGDFRRCSPLKKVQGEVGQSTHLC